MIRLLTSTILAVLLLACSGAGTDTETKAETALDTEGAGATETYDLRGEVIRLVPEDQVAVIKHEDIGDWMKAMTMDFPVKDKAEFDKLTPGAQIEAKVKVRDLDFWLEDIHVLPAGDGGQ